jgi:sulfate permease, SulP family
VIALLEARRAGLYARKFWLPNLVAGLVVGVVALPLAMAFAIASGAKPEQGLYTSIVAGIAVSVFGGSRLQIAGPTGAFIVILAGITAKYGYDGLQIATLMAGVMLFALGRAKLGGIIKYIPNPVIVGFTAGIGVIIWVGEWHDFFGLPVITGAHFHQKLLNAIELLPDFHPATTMLALLSLLILIVSPRLLKRIPAPLIAMAVATLLQAIFQFQGVGTIGSVFGEMPQALPRFHWPLITFPRIIELIGPAFTIAMLGAIESLLSAVVADGMAGTKHDSNQELVGQGIANLLTPLFGGFAATGAIARTATNIRNGGSSPLAGITHSVTLILIIVLFAPLASDIPLCCLAAILFVVSYNMSDLPHLVRMVRQAPRTDVTILATTFFLTVFADLVVAVNIGVILSSLLFMRRMARAVEVRVEDHVSLAHDLDDLGLARLPDGIFVYAIDGPFFFGAAERFEQAMSASQSEPEVLVIRLRNVPFMDITGLEALKRTVGQFISRGCRVVLCEANKTVREKLARAGILREVGPGNDLPTFAAAIRSVLAAQSGELFPENDALDAVLSTPKPELKGS